MLKFSPTFALIVLSLVSPVLPQSLVSSTLVVAEAILVIEGDLEVSNVEARYHREPWNGILVFMQLKLLALQAIKAQEIPSVGNFCDKTIRFGSHGIGLLKQRESGISRP